jgi:dipeptidase E
VKLLLTSGGVTNPSILSVLVQLLGKPIDECHALCVPTAQWGHPMCGPTSVRDFVAAVPKPDRLHMSGLGWGSLGVIELTALPTMMTPRIRDYFIEWSSAPDDRTLGVVDFSIFPHLNLFPTNTMADAQRWAADIGVPAYAIDEQTAIKVVDGSVEVISEGQWKNFG